MPLTSEEARKRLQGVLEREERDAAYVSRKIGKSYQWVRRRLDGTTRMFIDDYGLILSAFEQQESPTK